MELRGNTSINPTVIYFAILNSRWKESEQGLAFLEHMYDLAIEHQYWGFLATSHNGSEAPI